MEVCIQILSSFNIYFLEKVFLCGNKFIFFKTSKEINQLFTWYIRKGIFGIFEKKVQHNDVL